MIFVVLLSIVTMIFQLSIRLINSLKQAGDKLTRFIVQIPHDQTRRASACLFISLSFYTTEWIIITIGKESRQVNACVSKMWFYPFYSLCLPHSFLWPFIKSLPYYWWHESVFDQHKCQSKLLFNSPVHSCLSLCCEHAPPFQLPSYTIGCSITHLPQRVVATHWCLLQFVFKSWWQWDVFVRFV